MSHITTSQEMIATELTEDDLRRMIEQIERRDMAKLPVSPTDIHRLHFLSYHFEEAHERALQWAFETAHLCLKH
jgi:hypothetical protein